MLKGLTACRALRADQDRFIFLGGFVFFHHDTGDPTVFFAARDAGDANHKVVAGDIDGLLGWIWALSGPHWHQCKIAVTDWCLQRFKIDGSINNNFFKERMTRRFDNLDRPRKWLRGGWSVRNRGDACGIRVDCKSKRGQNLTRRVEESRRAPFHHSPR